jgi:hypothetical protein
MVLSMAKHQDLKYGKYNVKMVPFGPIRIKAETLDVLHSAAIHRTAASIVRELIELWAEARKEKASKRGNQ